MSNDTEHAAERRADYLRALGEELEAVKAQGKDDRVKAVAAEIARVKKAAPKGRKAPDADET